MVVERDDTALSRAFAVAAFRIGGGRRGYRKAVAEAAAGVNHPAILAVACTDAAEDGSTLYVMCPAGTDMRELSLDGAPPSCPGWGEVDDCVLARLLLNSFARAEGLTDPVNETGCLYRVVKREKNVVRALEPVVGRDLSVSIKVVSFTNRGYLKKERGGRLPKELAGAASYRVNELGAIVYSREPTDDDFVMKSLGRYDHAVFDFVRGEGAAEAVSRTKLGFLDEVLSGLSRRYGDMVSVSLERRERSGFLPIEKSEPMKREVLERVGGEELRVSYSVPALRGAAGRLARALGNAKMKRVNEPGALNIRIVPDEVAMEDGYAVYSAEAVQHVTASVAEAVAKRIESGKKSAVLEGILKELAVKRDVSAGRISAFDWSSFGIESFRCARPVEVRTKRPGDKGEGEPAAIGRETLLGVLEIDRDGSMEFRTDSELAVLDEGWTESLLSDDGGRLRCDRVACSMKCEHGSWDFSVTDTALFTVPNDLHRLIREQVEEGKLARSATSGGWDGALAPIFGIGSIEMDGATWYYVGHSKGMGKRIMRMTRLRRVDGLDGSGLETFLGLLNIGLARLGQPSVYPIPVKYLNEYAALSFGRAGDQQQLDLF